MQPALKSHFQATSDCGKALKARNLMRPEFFWAELMMSRFI